MQRSHYEKTVKTQDASRLSVGIVVSDFNSDVTERLLTGAQTTLKQWGVKEKNIRVIHVPGSFEIPFGCIKLLSGKKKPDAIIALGCVIKGETEHDRYISNAVAAGITTLTINYKVPIAFGVITPNSLTQARVRSTGKHNKGVEAATAALMCALLP
ncbi:6,7-dimethyl-8-ribityllumazine synthase [Patescibacteria group bacterium]|nr:6,7-dimethyl-8-ribityllumazine synthase [Patescibacteria group bacterium]